MCCPRLKWHRPCNCPVAPTDCQIMCAPIIYYTCWASGPCGIGVLEETPMAPKSPEDVFLLNRAVTLVFPFWNLSYSWVLTGALFQKGCNFPHTPLIHTSVSVCSHQYFPKHKHIPVYANRAPSIYLSSVGRCYWNITRWLIKLGRTMSNRIWNKGIAVTCALNVKT